MPNLTDVLNDINEDKPTVEELAKGVCIPLAGGTLPTLAFINFTVSDTEQSGYTWTAPNGTWEAKATHGGTGYTFGFGPIGSPVNKLRIWETALGLVLTNSALTWDGERVLVSNPIASADAVTNIMSLTQTEYDAIGTPDDSTLYVINGA